MDRLFNVKALKTRRRELRKNMTEAELIIWSCLKNKKILGQKFRRQFGVGQFILDFYCPKLKLAIEIDGIIHQQEGHPEYDKERELYLNTGNIKVLRFTNKDVFNNLNIVLERIKKEIEILISAK
jgi:very-short-patch-repair endonuclease